MRFSYIFIVFLLILNFTFSGCVATGTHKPPEGATLVNFKPPAIGTEVKWDVVEYGKESIENSVLSIMDIDGKSFYYWKNSAREVNAIYDLETMNWVGKWSNINNEWGDKATPHNGNKQYPLWAGKSYSANYFFSVKNGWKGNVTTKVNVESWETITVPAGEFEVLKIVQKNKHYTATHWYSPELGMGVKFKLKHKRGLRSGELMELRKP